MTVETDFLSVEDLLRIAERVLGTFHIRDAGLLESAVQRPRIEVFGRNPYPTAYDQAGALMHSLSRNHCLLDGNKRLAWSAMRVFLSLNGIEIRYDVDEAERFVLEVTVGNFDVVDIASWIHAHEITPAGLD